MKKLSEHPEYQNEDELDLAQWLWSIFGYGAVVKPLTPSAQHLVSDEPADVVCHLPPEAWFVFFDTRGSKTWGTQVAHNSTQMTNLFRRLMNGVTEIKGSNVIADVGPNLGRAPKIAMLLCSDSCPAPVLADLKQADKLTSHLRQDHPGATVSVFYVSPDFIRECAAARLSAADFSWLVSWNADAIMHSRPALRPADYASKAVTAATEGMGESPDIRSWRVGLFEQGRIAPPIENASRMAEVLSDDKNFTASSSRSPDSTFNMLRIFDRVSLATIISGLDKQLDRSRNASGLIKFPFVEVAFRFNVLKPEWSPWCEKILRSHPIEYKSLLFCHVYSKDIGFPALSSMTRSKRSPFLEPRFVPSSISFSWPYTTSAQVCRTSSTTAIRRVRANL